MPTTIDAARLVFDANPIAVGRDFVVYAATLDGERVVVKAGLPRRAQAASDEALEREHDVLVALGRRRASQRFVPAVKGLSVLGDGRMALVMRFVEGVSLSTLIERALVRHRYQGARRWNGATRALFGALAQAVEAIHEAGFVHNDLKPENVLVRERGGGLEVVLIDFALAAPEGRGGPGGTVSYAATERLDGASGTRRSDVWALGAILYELLAGTRPYPADLPADALLERQHPVDRLPRESATRAWAALPAGVKDALVRALARGPSERPRGVAQMVKRLDVRRSASSAPPVAIRREAASPRPRAGTWRLGLGALLVLVGGALGVGLGLAAARHGASGGPALSMCLDGHGVDACKQTLQNPTFASVLGIPVALWAAALHAVLLATIGVRLVGRRGNLTLLMLVVILLAGTSAYLVIGLAVMDVRCTLCLAMHGAALVVGLGGLLVVFERGQELGLRRARAWAGVMGALAAWVLVAVGITAISEPRRAHANAAAPSAAVAPMTDRCPGAVVNDLLDVPPDQASIVLADPGGRSDVPVLVEYLDLECDACRAAHAGLTPLYREIVRTRRAGLRLVLAADLAAKNGAVSRSAPASLVCAARHGGGLAALDFIDWELRASPGYYRPEDRRRWLATRLGDDAVRCLDAELLAPDGGSLAGHAAWAADMKRLAAARPECVDADDRGAWWCWVGTPSFGIFRPRAGAPRAASQSGLDAGLATASEAARVATLAQCLEP